MKLEYCGHIYDENTDFVALLRAAARNEYVPGVRDDLVYWAGLGALHEALMGTPPGKCLAEAALTLMETGTPEEFCLVQGLGYDLEPGISERLLAFIERYADRIPRSTRGIGCFLRSLMEALPTHPAAIAFLRSECQKPDSGGLWLSARFDADWFLGRLSDFLRGGMTSEISDCLYRLPEAKKPQFLEIVAASSAKNVEAVVQEYLDAWRGDEADLRYEAILNSHPAFAEALIRLRRTLR